MEQSIDRPFKSAVLNAQYIFNYNIMAAIVAIPMVIAAIFFVKAKMIEAEGERNKWTQRAKWAIG